MTIETITVNKKPITDPSIVLLGLIELNLCLPVYFPPKYAAESHVQMSTKIYITGFNFEYSLMLPSNMNGIVI